MSYERIEPIGPSGAVDRATRVVPLHPVGRREEPPEDQQQRGQPRREPEPPEDDGRPHVDVLV
jgi:hypothetical protein